MSWYRNNGVIALEEGGGPNGALVVSRDNDDGGLNMPEINRLITFLR